MKKSILVVMCLFVGLIIPAVSFSAPPQIGPYFSAQIGVAVLPDSHFTEPPDYHGTLEFDPGYAAGVAGGYSFGMFRIEGEIGYQNSDMDGATVCFGGYCQRGSVSDSNVSALSFMGNAYFDFVNRSPVTPYITAGLGMAEINLDIDDESGDDKVFAYQVGVGVAFAVAPNVSLDFRYRYFATEDPEIDDFKFEFASHNFYGGVRLTF